MAQTSNSMLAFSSFGQCVTVTWMKVYLVPFTVSHGRVKTKKKKYFFSFLFFFQFWTPVKRKCESVMCNVNYDDRVYVAVRPYVLAQTLSDAVLSDTALNAVPF